MQLNNLKISNRAKQPNFRRHHILLNSHLTSNLKLAWKMRSVAFTTQPISLSIFSIHLVRLKSFRKSRAATTRKKRKFRKKSMKSFRPSSTRNERWKMVRDSYMTCMSELQRYWRNITTLFVAVALFALKDSRLRSLAPMMRRSSMKMNLNLRSAMISSELTSATINSTWFVSTGTGSCRAIKLSTLTVTQLSLPCPTKRDVQSAEEKLMTPTSSIFKSRCHCTQMWMTTGTRSRIEGTWAASTKVRLWD